MAKRTLLCAVTAASVLLMASAALADDKGPADISKDGDGLLYDFKDADKLGGNAGGASGALIKLRNHVMRRTLIRPRANFVPELLKSVEQI